jgi:hypothetical protein
MFLKSALLRTCVLVATLAVPVCVEGSELTSGSVYRFGFFPSRIALGSSSLSYSGTFYSYAWYSTPCVPCYPGHVVNTSNGFSLNTTDFNNARVTMGNQTYSNWGYFFPDPPFPYAKFISAINFDGDLVEVPFSDGPDLILVTPFTMQGTVEGFSSSAKLFGDFISGNGFVWLHLRRVDQEGTPAYNFLEISYQIATRINVDVKPGDGLNYINLKSQGKTPIAILSTATFDAGTVDPATVTVAGAPVSLRRNGTTASSLEDVNADGLLDLVVHISTKDLQPTNPNQVLLEGYTISGERLWGIDEMILAP